MSGNADDPRDANLETKLTMPKTWTVGGSDSFSAASMLISGAVMVTRNRILAWPALIFGLSSFVNQHPLRSKDTGSSWNGLITGVSAVLLAYMPMFLVGNKPALTQAPLPASA